MQDQIGIAIATFGLLIFAAAFLVRVGAGIYVAEKAREVSMTFWPKWATVCGCLMFAGAILLVIGQYLRAKDCRR